MKISKGLSNSTVLVVALLLGATTIALPVRAGNQVENNESEIRELISSYFEARYRSFRELVLQDLGSARPAGRIFQQEGQWIRPGQDSRRRYGGALTFNRITRLDEEGYSEEAVAGFSPPGGPVRATHTFNQTAGMTVIDAVLRRRR